MEDKDDMTLAKATEENKIHVAKLHCSITLNYTFQKHKVQKPFQSYDVCIRVKSSKDSGTRLLKCLRDERERIRED